jgi:hypothetical protein
VCNCSSRTNGTGSQWNGTSSPQWEYTPTGGRPPQMYWSEEEARRATATYGGTYRNVGSK